MTARPLYARWTELDADNSYEGNDLEKKVSLEAVPKNSYIAIYFVFSKVRFAGGLGVQPSE